MKAQYENQGGLLVKPGTNECAGYIFNFEGHGAYGPTKVETPEGGPTQAEIDAHNAILAKSEREFMVKEGRGTFYLSNRKPDICYGGNVFQATVSQWSGEWKASWSFVRGGYSYGFARVRTYWVWFTGPDGKKWYGVNKGDMDCFTGRRLKNQK